MESIEQFLQERRENNLLRTLKPASFRRQGIRYVDNKEFIDFSSNDYLGLCDHPDIQKVFKESIDRFGVGSSASRLLSGDLEIYHQLEQNLAKFKQKESALVFNSGYQANVGIISALVGRGDVIFCDKLSHASIIDGVILSGAKLFRFLHNDTNNLEGLLKKQRNKFKSSLIITETIFSMDGDRAPLREISILSKKYNCKIMVDEAHATGIFGESGSGLVEQENVVNEIDFIMGTFSKALGSFGAYLACSDKIKKFLINTCRSFIYSTALPPAIIAVNLASLDLVEKEPFRRKTLLENADYFRDKLKEKRFKVKGSSQIIPLIVGESKKAIEMSQNLQNKGYWIQAIRQPTVPKGESRLRFSLTYHHTKEVLEKLARDIYEVS